MIKISYYKAVQGRLPKAFCMIAEKCYHNDIKIFVYTKSEKYTFELDTVLWTYSRKQFIPHSTIHDLLPEKQSILIGSELKNLSHYSAMIIVNASENMLISMLLSERNLFIKQYTRLFFLYDDNILLSSKNIKDVLSKFLEQEFEFKSFLQNDNNSWQAQNVVDQ